jgi:uncharacterized membrane protein SirB2
MNLASWYPWIKQAHIALVTASGALFALRGLALLAGARWPLRPAPRLASVAIDTLLLAAGATLWALLRLDPLRDHWLGAKLVLLVLYVLLGSWAFKSARGTAQRAALFAAALLVFATMVSVALTRQPLGVWRGWA